MEMTPSDPLKWQPFWISLAEQILSFSPSKKYFYVYY